MPGLGIAAGAAWTFHLGWESARCENFGSLFSVEWLGKFWLLVIWLPNPKRDRSHEPRVARNEHPGNVNQNRNPEGNLRKSRFFEKRQIFCLRFVWKFANLENEFFFCRLLQRFLKELNRRSLAIGVQPLRVAMPAAADPR